MVDWQYFKATAQEIPLVKYCPDTSSKRIYKKYWLRKQIIGHHYWQSFFSKLSVCCVLLFHVLILQVGFVYFFSILLNWYLAFLLLTHKKYTTCFLNYYLHNDSDKNNKIKLLLFGLQNQTSLIRLNLSTT